MLTLLLLACFSSESDSGTELSPCEQTMVLEIGQGEQRFEPFEDPAHAMLVHGPQGGWHVLASVRAQPVGTIADIHYTITDLHSGVEISNNRYAVALVPEADCAGVFPGMYGFVDVSGLQQGELDTPPELLAGRRLQLTIALADDQERTASASVEVVAVLDPIDVQDAQEGEP